MPTLLRHDVEDDINDNESPSPSYPSGAVNNKGSGLTIIEDQLVLLGVNVL